MGVRSGSGKLSPLEVMALVERIVECAKRIENDTQALGQAAQKAADSVALLDLTFTAIPEPPPVPQWRQKREQEAARNLHRRGRR